MEKKKLETKIGNHDDNEIRAIVDEFKNESDRATVILGAAKIDAMLYLLITKFLKPCSGNQDELLDGDSPLGTFSARINICQRLGLINIHFAKSLHIIRRIRNSFAHEFKGVALSSGSHSDRIRELTMYFKDFKQYQEFKGIWFDDKEGLDIDFRLILIICILRLDGAIHYTNGIIEDGYVFIPPSWEKIKEEVE